MSADEWKPGDVAVAQHPFAANSEVRGIIDTDGRFYTTDQDVRGISSSAFALSNLRPLVVIDPEDREAVRRLTVEIARRTDGFTVRGVDATQAALREFANPTPPKPKEPTGLGAVVEDADGQRWVRAGRDHDGRLGDNWRGVDGGSRGGWWSDYAEIDAVRVLSEGVTP